MRYRRYSRPGRKHVVHPVGWYLVARHRVRRGRRASLRPGGEHREAVGSGAAGRGDRRDHPGCRSPARNRRPGRAAGVLARAAGDALQRATPRRLRLPPAVQRRHPGPGGRRAPAVGVGPVDPPPRQPAHRLRPRRRHRRPPSPRAHPLGTGRHRAVDAGAGRRRSGCRRARGARAGQREPDPAVRAAPGGLHSELDRRRAGGAVPARAPCRRRRLEHRSVVEGAVRRSRRLGGPRGRRAVHGTGHRPGANRRGPAARAAMPEFVMGMVSAGRTAAESLEVVGPCMKLLPVACRIDDSGSVPDHLNRTAAALREALESTDVPFEDIVTALGLGGDDSCNPLVQVAFAAHDELVPDGLRTRDLTVEIREGHCGGTVYDAVLYVQRWDGQPRLALEYATSVLRADEAAELARAVDFTLVELAAAPDGPLADVRTMTPAQRRRLESLGRGPAVDATAGLWQLFEAAARRDPDAVAVRDADPARALTYRQLLRAAEVQSAELAAAGVASGDCVALAVRRSAREILAILAILRIGAAYTGIERDIPAPAVATILDSAGARVVLGDDDRLAALGDAHGRRVLRILDPWAAAATRDHPVPVAAAPADPARIAYVAFTSGSTGAAKGTRVPYRGVVRLTVDPTYLRPGACDRFVRLAPLAFDASTLEIFAPLVAGGTVDVYSDDYVTPDGLADFLRARGSTGLWLTAGLFRLVADYHPQAFQGVLQILTGGDVVPPAQVIQVLRACPGLQITNGYGPTENTTFTTVHHVADPAEVEDPLPIGRPIEGTGALVLDPAGRLVPPGGIGELYTSGDGLALGYAGLPAETARAFGHFSADTGELLYRTGDLVRWDGGGRLRFLGRRDRQVKIRGFRIELDVVARVLREHPAARDVAVVATASGSADRRLLAGIVAQDEPGLLDAVRDFAAQRLPGYAVPSLWAVVPELPVTRNGKLDSARLRELALSREPGTGDAVPAQVPDPGPASHGAGSGERDNVARTIARAWQDVLGTDRFGADERFFDVGGDSLQLLRVAANLRRDLPGHDITIQDLYACQTIRTLTGRLRTRARQ